MTDSYDGQERRRHERHSYSYLVDFDIRFCPLGSDEFAISTGGNISFGGVLLDSKISFSMDDSMQVEIRVRDKKQDEMKTLVLLTGSVAWVDDKQNPDTGETQYEIGVVFSDQADKKETLLKNFIHEYILSEDMIRKILTGDG